MTSEGVIWVETGDQIFSVEDGKVRETIDATNFDVVGVDRWGRIWGNRYEHLGPGGSRFCKSAVVIDDGQFVEIQADVEIKDVNRDAGAIGKYALGANLRPRAKQGPILVANGRLIEPELPANSRLIDINESGVVLGEYWQGTGENSVRRHFTYAQGKRENLGFSKGKDIEVVKINDSGSLLYSERTERGNKILLRKAP